MSLFIPLLTKYYDRLPYIGSNAKVIKRDAKVIEYEL